MPWQEKSTVYVPRIAKGCEISHPSQRQHDCVVMPEEEGWEVYCDIAVNIVNNEEMILKQFIKPLRISRLRFHKDALAHLRQLEKSPMFTLYTLWQLYCNNDDPEILCILNYLKYSV